LFWSFTLAEYINYRSSYEGEERAKWIHTSSTHALLANINRGKNTTPYTANDFNPYAQQAEKGDKDKVITAPPIKLFNAMQNTLSNE
tara:strand:- start:2819 stop:3079 length:261 start_codon:yes stop_codon:yes gene_type:complete